MQSMLHHLYIEALLTDPETADQIYEAWHSGEISDYWAMWMWYRIVPKFAM